MNDLKKQVHLAQRRLLAQQFLSVAPWALFGTLAVAALAILLKKLVPMEIDGRTWTIAWLVGGLLGGLALAIGITYWRRSGMLDAAIEVDHRCGLKERVSSCLALTPEEQDSEAGQALLEDAQRRIAQADVEAVHEEASPVTNWGL